MVFHYARLSYEKSALIVIKAEENFTNLFCGFANYMLQTFEVMKALAVKMKRFS